ncbi:MAG: hypothetical protein ACTS6H_00395 [Candidatus Hodgkinia cicadicola]
MYYNILLMISNVSHVEPLSLNDTIWLENLTFISAETWLNKFNTITIGDESFVRLKRPRWLKLISNKINLVINFTVAFKARGIEVSKCNKFISKVISFETNRRYIMKLIDLWRTSHGLERKPFM